MRTDSTLTLCFMPVGEPSDRSFEPFTDEHLDRLTRIALDDQAAMFESQPPWSCPATWCCS